jgi:ribosomal protein L13E
MALARLEISVGHGAQIIGLYLFAAALTAILPVLTHVFGVRAQSSLGAGFLVAEAAAAGLAAITLAGRKATVRQEAAERGGESIAEEPEATVKRPTCATCKDGAGGVARA